jgi:redox-sensitive bicupin YhaK (pirin superfamily)
MRSRVALEPSDPHRADPFLALVEDWMQEPGGFPDHPHRGFEAVTLVLEGKLAHSDASRHGALLSPGDVQWITAGRGVLHAEMPGGQGETHTLQLWVNLPAAEKMRAPGTQHLVASSVPVLRGDGISVRVISGEQLGVRGPAENVVPVLYLDVELRRGAEVLVGVSPEHQGLAYALRGAVEVDGKLVRAGSVAFLAEGDPAAVRARATIADARFVLAAGPPLHEPVVADGPFVMNSEAQIAQAHADYRAGRIGR